MAKYLSNFDLNQNQLLNAVIQQLATAPSNPKEGQIYFNTATKRYMGWNNSAWIGLDALDSSLSGAQMVTAINASASLIDDNNLSSAVNDAISKAHNTHAIATVTGLQTALDGKVDDAQVLTNVPAGALFTDTVTSINGKTGVIVKADIVALGIPTSDTNTTYVDATTTVSGLMSGADKTKLNGVATGANNYSLPIAASGVLGGVKSGTSITVDASGNVTVVDNSHAHTVANVTGLQTALDGKVDDGQVLTNVPAGALFTDTVTSINGATGVISKANIVALGIPAQDTVYVHPVGTNPHATTKADVGLGNVDNTTDAGKPVSTAQATAIALKSNLASPTFTGVPAAPTAIAGTNTTQLATTAFVTAGLGTKASSTHTHVIADVTSLQTELDAKETPAGATSKASTAENNAKAYADAQITALVGSSPATLNTLNELATALGNDPNFATTITNNIATKADIFSAVIGDGVATSIVVTHNLNSRNIIPALRESASPYAIVYTDIEMTTVDTATIRFGVAPAVGAYTISLIG